MATTLPVYNNPSAISTDAGSPYWTIALWSTDNKTLDSNVVMGPWAKSTTIKDTTDVKEVEDEKGISYIVQGGKRQGEVEITYIQQDKASRMMYEDLRGKRFVFVKEMSAYLINGKKQVGIGAYCMSIPEFDASLPGSEGKFKFRMMPAPAQTTINLTSFTSGFTNALTCPTCTLNTNDVWLMYEA